jgi:hypothetical protein
MSVTWDPFTVRATIPIPAVRGATAIGRAHPHAPRSKLCLLPSPARAAAVATAAVAGVGTPATPFVRFPVAAAIGAPRVPTAVVGKRRPVLAILTIGPGVPPTLRKVAIVAHSPHRMAAVVGHSTAVATAAMDRRRGQRRTAGGNCSRSQSNCNLVGRCFAEHAFTPLSGNAPQPLSAKHDRFQSSCNRRPVPECHGIFLS